ncbi:XRE family transcriptional regulator [Virgibacillus halodenitrificans]|nr:XRE family transcriptional regulator [Virgibacillus halodenitrificans]
MYRNLEAEMARMGITKKSMAEELEMRYPTMTEKLKGKYPLRFDEAIKIQQRFFPDHSLEYLFETKEEIRHECQ